MSQISKISAAPVSGVVGYSRISKESRCASPTGAILSSSGNRRLSLRDRGLEFIRS